MEKAFIPTAMSTEEMILIYQAIDVMVTALMANKNHITDPEMLEDLYKYRKLKAKLGKILDMSDKAEKYLEEHSDDVVYSEREKE